jgi:hypothetical protein
MKKRFEDTEKNIRQVIEFSVSFSDVNGNISTDIIARRIEKENLKLDNYKCIEFLNRVGENKNKFIKIIRDFEK